MSLPCGTLSDRRRMKAYIASRIPEEGCRVVLADGPDGEVWADLDPVRYDEGELDLHLETNCPEWAGIAEAYDHLRREEMTVEEWRLEIAGGACRNTNKPASRAPASVAKEAVSADDKVTPHRQLITPKECQRERFQNKISLRQVYELFYRGELDGFRVGRKVLLFDDSVESYILRNRTGAVARVREQKQEAQVNPVKPKEEPQLGHQSGFRFFHLPEGR